MQNQHLSGSPSMAHFGARQLPNNPYAHQRFGNQVLMIQKPQQQQQQQQQQPQQQQQISSLQQHTLLAQSLQNSLQHNSINSAGPFSSHHQKHLELHQLSRRSASPHHHARAAAMVVRGNYATNLQSSLSDPQNTSISKDPSEKTAADSNQKWTALDIGGMGVKNLSPSLFSYTFLTTLYLNHNNLLYIPSEIMRLNSLTVLNVSSNKLTSLPQEIGLLINLTDLLAFDNSIAKIPMELGNLYQLQNLGLEGNPISEPLLSLLQKEGTAALISFLRDNCPAPPQPGERQWVSLDTANDISSGEETFTMYCHNVLCEKYATPQSYGYTPSWALSWQYRRDLILQEILSYNADIICLQEVESSQFEEFFQENLSKMGGYDGVFWPKSRAKTMTESEKKSVDGCATFFKKSKFSLVEKELIEFNQMALQRPDFPKTDTIFNRLLTKDNIAVFTLLQSKQSGSRILVANTHIHWDPSYSDVKIVQTSMLIEEIENSLKKHFPGKNGSTFSASSCPVSVVICGDFNSTPDSGVVEFMSRGQLNEDHEDFGEHSYGNYTEDGITHKFNFKSAYSHIGELKYTNYTAKFKGVIDYIWYSAQSLNVVGVLGDIPHEYFKTTVGFPNAHFPSDHISLIGEFRFKPLSPNSKTRK